MADCSARFITIIAEKETGLYEKNYRFAGGKKFHI